MSTDFREKALKTKRHLNSFHPKLGFFIHLEDVLSWLEPDVDPTWYEMVRPHPPLFPSCPLPFVRATPG